MVCIKDMMREELVILNLEAADKIDALQNITSRLRSDGRIPEHADKELFDRLKAKETQTSTAVGNGIAIPHVYFEAIPEPVIVFTRLIRPVDYDSPDGRPVDKIFLLMGPKRNNTEYLRILARLAHLFKDSGFLEKLSAAETNGAVIKAVTDVECRH